MRERNQERREWKREGKRGRERLALAMWREGVREERKRTSG